MTKINLTQLFHSFMVFFFLLSQCWALEGIESLLFEEVPIVTTSTLVEVTFDENPGSMTVITRKEIDVLGLRNLLDVYDLIPNFQTFVNVSNEVTKSIRGYGVRTASQMKLLIDGHPVNDALYQGVQGYDLFPLDQVKQIEIIRGPGSALYGTNAFVAVINLVMDREEKGYLSVTGGEWGSTRLNLAQFSDPYQEVRYGLFFDVLNEDGTDLEQGPGLFFGTPFARAPVKHKRSIERLDIGGYLGYKIMDISFGFNEQDQDWPEGAVAVRTIDPPSSITDYYYLDIKLKHVINTDSYLEAKIGYDRNNYNYFGPHFPRGFTLGADVNHDGVFDIFPNGAIAFDAGITGESYDIEFNYQKKLDRHNILLGIHFGEESLIDVETKLNFHPTHLFRVPDGTQFTGSEAWVLGEGFDETYGAIVLQDIYTVSPNLKLIYGARHDTYEVAGDTFSPRIAAIISIDNDTTLKLSYGEAFSRPLIFQQFVNFLSLRGNPDLSPEEVRTFEVVLQNKYKSKAHYAITLFHNEIEDVVITNIVQNPSFSNTGKVEAMGIEYEIDYHLNESFRGWANGAFNKVTDEEVDADLEFSFDYLFNLGFTLEAFEDFYISSWLHGAGEQARAASNVADPADPWEIVNLSLLYTGFKNFKLSVIAKNIFDKEYATAANINGVTGQKVSDTPANPRQILAKASYQWG